MNVALQDNLSHGWVLMKSLLFLVNVYYQRKVKQMSHEKTTKESIKYIIKDIQNFDDDDDIEKAVNRIDLLIQTMMRQVKLGNKDVHER